MILPQRASGYWTPVPIIPISSCKIVLPIYIALVIVVDSTTVDFFHSQKIYLLNPTIVSDKNVTFPDNFMLKFLYIMPAVGQIFSNSRSVSSTKIKHCNIM